MLTTSSSPSVQAETDQFTFLRRAPYFANASEIPNVAIPRQHQMHIPTHGHSIQMAARLSLPSQRLQLEIAAANPPGASYRRFQNIWQTLASPR